MRVQVKLLSPFIRSNPKGSEGITKVLPEAFPNAKGGTMVEVEARTNQSSISLPLLHRTDVFLGRLLGFRDSWRQNSCVFRVVS